VEQATEGAFAGGMPEVVGPPTHDLVEPGQHGPWISLRLPVRQGGIFAFTDRSGRSAMKV
jgi:hypothetical protein